jgi:hypothetical protein
MIGSEFEHLCQFKCIFKMALGYESGWGRCVMKKNHKQKSGDRVPLKPKTEKYSHIYVCRLSRQLNKNLNFLMYSFHDCKLFGSGYCTCLYEFQLIYVIW